MAVRGLRAGLRHQGADVPVPHLAARRPRRGAHGRLGDPGRRAAEDGHLRLPAAGHPALPAGGPGVRPVDRPAGRDRHRLRRAGLAGAARHEEAGGLLLGQPPGLRDAGHRGLQPRLSVDGRHLPDAQPRHLHRRAVPPRRHALRAPPHAPDRRVRRTQERDALVRGHLPDGLPVLDRRAGLQRLRGRVPDPGGLVELGLAPGGGGLAGRDPGGGLHPVDGQARAATAR